MGAWIEIQTLKGRAKGKKSLLSWERGLKSPDEARFFATMVAPLVGAWIEIKAFTGDFKTFLSLLSWERGLKYGIKAVT